MIVYTLSLSVETGEQSMLPNTNRRKTMLRAVRSVPLNCPFAIKSLDFFRRSMGTKGTLKFAEGKCGSSGQFAVVKGQLQAAKGYMSVPRHKCEKVFWKAACFSGFYPNFRRRCFNCDFYFCIDDSAAIRTSRTAKRVALALRLVADAVKSATNT